MFRHESSAPHYGLFSFKKLYKYTAVALCYQTAKVYFISYLMKFKHVPLPAQHLGMYNIWNIYKKMSNAM